MKAKVLTIEQWKQLRYSDDGGLKELSAINNLIVVKGENFITFEMTSDATSDDEAYKSFFNATSEIFSTKLDEIKKNIAIKYLTDNNFYLFSKI